ncbi:MAG: DUF6172 family protein [Burkholderiaceae bacterium]
MKKTFPLTLPGRHPDRVREALKHEIRQYLRRERRKPLAEGVDFLDFDCRFGLSADDADTTSLQELMHQIDAAATSGATHVYVELLAKPGQRTARPPAAESVADGATPTGDAHALAPADGGGNT